MEVGLPHIARRRREYQEQLKDIDPNRLVFLDESCCNTGMVRTHALAPGGKRAVAYRPMSGRRRLTMVGAIRLEGLVTLSKHRGGTTGPSFLSFVRYRLCPKLRKGDVVVMNNLSAHKVAGVREAIEWAGAWLVYLPPYSPELNPIEPAWSKLKGILRKLAAATPGLLHRAISAAARQIRPADAAGWFQHCGYHLRSRGPRCSWGTAAICARATE